MTPIIMTTPVSVATGSCDGTRGGSHCRSASAADRTADDRASHSTAPCGTLGHGISGRYGNPEG
jgi:hypothetical protein